VQAVDERLSVEESASGAPRILLVDDDPAVRGSLGKYLQHSGFKVIVAEGVTDALKHISAQPFDVLLSDLHMPGAGDGLTVVSAMRHTNPKAVTLILSSFPEMEAAATSILRQTDQIMVKPMGATAIVEAIRERLKGNASAAAPIKSVADILEAQTGPTIEEWIGKVDLEPHIITVKLSNTDRSAYLPQLFRELVFRLRNPLPLGGRSPESVAATAHGLLRRKQGYTPAMLVEESRMLQVSIFQTLQNNLENVDFSILLVGVMAIADEVDSQLAQQMASYVSESKVDAKPMTA
jgi:DNA-binding response OmpR family regulator